MSRHPRPTARVPASSEDLFEACLHHAARLADAMRSGSRTQVAGLLALTPGGRVDVLAMAAAAMVDTNRTVTELLAWTSGPRRAGGSPLSASTQRRGARTLPREHDTERGYKQHHHLGEPACEPCLAAHAVNRHPEHCRAEYRRLRAAGVPPRQAAHASRPTVLARQHAERVTTANRTAA